MQLSTYLLSVRMGSLKVVSTGCRPRKAAHAQPEMGHTALSSHMRTDMLVRRSRNKKPPALGKVAINKPTNRSLATVRQCVQLLPKHMQT